MKLPSYIKKNLFHRSNLILILLVLMASLGVIVLNHYTIKILSASRAYINGESLYSKGQKDASYYLLLYTYSVDPADWEKFNQEIKVPLGFQLYRNGLDNGDDNMINKGLTQARFPKTDWDNVIWLYRNFGNSFLMQPAIKEWKRGDAYINRLFQIGKYAHSKLKRGNVSERDKKFIVNRINNINKLLVGGGKAYSNAFGYVDNLLGDSLFIFNIVMTLLIMGSVGTYAVIMINRISRSKREVEELSHIKDQFISVASHELKTPITTMKAFLQVLERIPLQQNGLSQLHPFISKANNQVIRLTSIINDLLDVSKIKDGQLQLRKNYFKLEEIIKEAIEQVNPIIDSHKIDIEGDLTEIIYVDKDRIQQVLINLLSNAIKYSPNQQYILIKVEKLENELKVSVKDSGIGIPEEKINRVFDRFFRVQEISDKFSGLGIGLYISSEIIKKHGGEMGVASKVNQGSVFWFKIPLVTHSEVLSL